MNAGLCMNRLRLSVAVAALVVLSACSSGSKRPEPAPLTPVSPQILARQVWHTQVGALDSSMTPVVQVDSLVLANQAGVVQALDVRTGQSQWRVDLKSSLSAGVGADGQTAAVVTVENELVAVSAQGERWRTRLPARVFTAPLVAGGRVFVLQADRAVAAYDARSGARLWSQPARNADALVLQQPGVLLAVGDTLVAGVAGRLLGLNPLNGSQRWEVAIARPRGINEIERLVDLVGRVGRVDAQVCARAFQSAVGCIDAARGSLLWSQPAEGAVGLHADEDRLYGVESNGRMVAWQRRTGERVWSHERLLHRGATAPLAAGRSIAVGDAQGYVHLFAREDGSVLHRLSTDGSPIVAGPLLAGGQLLALTRNGGVFAWRSE